VSFHVAITDEALNLERKRIEKMPGEEGRRGSVWAIRSSWGETMPAWSKRNYVFEGEGKKTLENCGMYIGKPPKGVLL